MRRITIAGARRRAGIAKRVAIAQASQFQDAWTHRGPRPPVEYAQWLKRQSGRKSAVFPDIWRSRSDWPFARPARVGVLVHVFYPELLGEIVSLLEAMPVEFDLIITNASGQTVEPEVGKLTNVLNHIVLDVENRGRDIWPMVQVVNAGLLDPYDVVLKVHTKRSEWRAEHGDLQGSGAEWRADLLGDLLGSTGRIESILSAFAADPDLGVVAGTGSVLGPEFWGGDEYLTRQLLRRIEMQFDPSALRFPAGSFYWCRGLVLQGLRSLCMSDDDFEIESGQIDATTAHAIERSIGIVCAEAGLSVVEASDIAATERIDSSWNRYLVDSPRHVRAEVVPFYLPQFHPIPENDRWWGAGFTEWTNVSAAAPVYTGHYQPKLPADLGFYDLRLDDVRAAQNDLASAHGVHGFMYYYYWFAGRRLLSLPIEKLLASDVQKNFCIMWANENWTRRWDGRTADILIGQNYDGVPAENFIDDVMPFLLDDRYLRVGGKPVLAVYRIAQVPNYVEVVQTWRERARAAGAGELKILSVDVAKDFDGLDIDAEAAGLDGTLGFPPHNTRWTGVDPGVIRTDRRFVGNVLSYPAVVSDAELALLRLQPTEFPGVMVTFDNTARRQMKSDVWFGSNPYTFRRWLAAAVSAVAAREPSERVVFLNAWNEWAEGAVLEPSDRFGRSYLHAVRDVVYG